LRNLRATELSRTALSKLGGLPDLPDASEWPCRDEKRHFRFLRRINVTRAAEVRLGGKSYRRIRSCRSSTTLKICPLDLIRNDKSSLVRPRIADFVRRATQAPAASEGLADEGVFYAVCALCDARRKLPEPFLAAIIRCSSSLNVSKMRILIFLTDTATAGRTTSCWVYAEQWQCDMQLDCQLVDQMDLSVRPRWHAGPRRDALEPGVSDWRVLLQVDTDDNAGMQWGDPRSLYYWIKAVRWNHDLSTDGWWLFLQY